MEIRRVIINSFESKDESSLSFTRTDVCIVGGFSPLSINVTDIRVRQRVPELSDFLPELPFTPGYAISGLIDGIGGDVQGSFHLNDHVVAIAPIDCQFGGCADFSIQKAVNVVRKPPVLSHDQAAACLLPSLRAYTSLHYLLRLKAREFLLFCGGTGGVDDSVLHVASTFNARVIACARNESEFNRYADSGPHVVRVIDLRNESVVQVVMEETGGLGVHCVLDCQYPSESNDDTLITKTDIIKCLGIRGRWVTDNPDLQLDPPDCRLLYLRCASVSFLFEQSWLLAPTEHGKYLHIIRDILQQMVSGNSTSQIITTRPLDKIREAHRLVSSIPAGVVVMTINREE